MCACPISPIYQRARLPLKTTLTSCEPAKFNDANLCKFKGPYGISTVYIETVSPLSTLNRYHVHLGSMLKMRRYCSYLQNKYHYYFSFLFFLQKYIEKNLDFSCIYETVRTKYLVRKYGVAFEIIFFKWSGSSSCTAPLHRTYTIVSAERQYLCSWRAAKPSASIENPSTRTQVKRASWTFYCESAGAETEGPGKLERNRENQTKTATEQRPIRR
jgi:hypothetical protein